MAKIKQIVAHEILNSEGFPTIETTVILTDGKSGTASIPSGKFKGSYEASEVRDGISNKFQGRGVLKAIQNIESIIAPKLIGLESTKQQDIDRMMIELDGTQNKGKLGANAILSISIAVAKASAKSSVLPLFLYLRQFINKGNSQLKIPTPIFSLINGREEPTGADFWEYLIIPPSSKPYEESIDMTNNILNSLKDILKLNNLSTLVGDTGSFSPKVQTNKECLFLLRKAIENINLRIGFDVFLGLDINANYIYKEGKYHLKDKTSPLSSSELMSYYEDLIKEDNLLYIEDPFYENDWEAWTNIYTKISQQTLICGDDLIATNPYRLQMAIDKKAITAVIIKPNQIGTVIESLAVVEVARAAGLKIVASTRTFETDDDFIADFAVAVSADYVKFGAPVRGERTAKYNRLFEIEEKIKSL